MSSSMASVCFSSVSLHNGSLSSTVASSRPDYSLLFCRKSLPQSLDSRSLSLSLSRSLSASPSSQPPQSPSSTLHSRRLTRNFVSAARAELTAEELDTVDFDEPPAVSEVSDLGSMNAPPEGPKLYVGNLPWTCNSQELADVFQKVGSVEMVEVIYDRETGRSRGFGFVTMSSMNDAQVAVEKLNGSEYGGRTIRVNFPDRNRVAGGGGSESPRARFDDSASNANKLFVGNLPWGLDDSTLEELFSKHGKVLEAKVIFDRETGRSRGFGFVTLSSSAEVNEALNNMDGADVEGRALRVNLASDRPSTRRDFF